LCDLFHVSPRNQTVFHSLGGPLRGHACHQPLCVSGSGNGRQTSSIVLGYPCSGVDRTSYGYYGMCKYPGRTLGGACLYLPL
ncbi:hypothetical protein LTR93_012357, partial [Exophiala xenobiotica]